MKAIKPLSIISFVLVFVFLFSSSIFAVSTTGNQNRVTINQETQNQGATTSIQTKQKTCLKKQAGINKRAQQLIKRTNLILTIFERHTTRVQDYYNDKLVPKGAVIENYEALLADIANKKAAVEVALATAKTDVAGFKCDSSNPKEQLKLFRADMTRVIRALKEYRTAVVNLIVAVRTKGKNIKSPGATGSATPSSTTE